MRQRMTAPVGGVMTDEVGAVTGDLEVWLEDKTVRTTYAGSTDTYTVTGSPLTEEASLEQVVGHLQTDPGADEAGNARSTDVRDLGLQI